MLDSIRSALRPANRVSRKRIKEVWSNNCEFTQPPLVHGETMIIGTRIPTPYGPAGGSASPGKISFVVRTVDRPRARVFGGVWGTRWAQKTPPSAHGPNKALLAPTPGFVTRGS